MYTVWPSLCRHRRSCWLLVCVVAACCMPSHACSRSSGGMTNCTELVKKLGFGVAEHIAIGMIHLEKIAIEVQKRYANGSRAEGGTKERFSTAKARRLFVLAGDCLGLCEDMQWGPCLVAHDRKYIVSK